MYYEDGALAIARGLNGLDGNAESFGGRPKWNLDGCVHSGNQAVVWIRNLNLGVHGASLGLNLPGQSHNFSCESIFGTGHVDVHSISHMNIGDCPFWQWNYETQNIVLRKLTQSEVALIGRS